MRTTITLDPDVEVRVKRLMHERGLSFKTAINETLRAGLDHDRRPGTPEPYALPVHDLGIRPDIDIDRITHLLDDLEDAEVVRKLAEGR